MAEATPAAATLLQACTDYLEQQLLPTLSAYHRFQTRVTINVLRIALRELQMGPASARAENDRLAGLLQHGGETAALNGELAESIASGVVALDTPGLADQLRQTLHEALAINNPKWTGRGADGN